MSLLREAAQQDLLGLGTRFEYPADTVLLRQGDSDTNIYLLATARSSGTACVKVVATSENGCESLLGLRISGDLLGELAGLCTAPRSATVTTCTPAAVHRFAYGRFKAFLARWPEAHYGLIAMIAGQLNWANRRRLEIAGYEVSKRLARVILDVLAQHGRQTERGYEVGIQLSQREWGQLIGSGEDAVRQAMRRMRDRGLIEPRYRRLTVTDREALRMYGDLG